MILDLDYLKNTYLRGLTLADQFGRPLPDTVLESKVRVALAAFERKYAVKLSPCIVKMGREPLKGEPFHSADVPLVERDALTYDPRSFEGDRHVNMRLPVGPVREVLSVGLLLPGMARPVEWPAQWLQLAPRGRRLQIYPMGQSLSWMPIQATGLAMMAMSSNRTIPNAWQVTYRAGYTADELAGEFADVLDALRKLATIHILIPGSIDRFAAQGIAGLSAGVDGLSNSTQLAGGGQTLRYQPLIEAYKQELEEWEKTYSERSRGVRMGVL